MKYLVALFSLTYYARMHRAQLHGEIGPSGVRALTLAAGINVGGHYKGHFFPSPLSLFLPAHC